MRTSNVRWVLAVCLSAGASGCTSEAGMSTDSAASVSAPITPPVAAAPEMSKGRPASIAQAAPIVIDQKLIRTGDIAIEIRDAEAGVRAADNLARTLGGLMADSRTARTTEGRLDAHVVIRVPADRFQEALAGLRRLGTVRNENVTTQDITKAYTDLEIRLAVKEETVTRLRALLANHGGKLSDILDVERELARAVTELEQLKGERRYFDQQVALSTITATLVEHTATGADRLVEPVASAFRRSLGVLGDSAAALVYLLVFLLPWVLVSVPLAWGARRVWVGRRPTPTPQ